MTTEKDKPEEKKELTQNPERSLTTQELLNHPVVMEMSARIDTLTGLLKSLPEAIGRSVQEAMAKRPPSGASGPPMAARAVVPGDGLEIRRGSLKVDGEEQKLQDRDRDAVPKPPKKKKKS